MLAAIAAAAAADAAATPSAAAGALAATAIVGTTASLAKATTATAIAAAAAGASTTAAAGRRLSWRPAPRSQPVRHASHAQLAPGADEWRARRALADGRRPQLRRSRLGGCAAAEHGSAARLHDFGV